MEGAKRTYEILNSELHDELPALHDSRILFLVTNMQTLFAAEEVFHSETAKVTYPGVASAHLLSMTCKSIMPWREKQKQGCFVWHGILRSSLAMVSDGCSSGVRRAGGSRGQACQGGPERHPA